MAPVVLPPISDEKCLEKQLERQIGCMTGFLQIFDRQQRIYAPRRLHCSGSSSPSEKSEHSAFPSSPESVAEKTPARPPLTPQLPFPVFDAWKLREAPRLSLDSRLRPRETRSITAASAGSEVETEKSRRPPSVVARLMGLDNLPEPAKNAELRRSASESRVSRDPYRFVDDVIFQKPPDLDPVSRSKPAPPAPKPATTRRKSFFDAHDFFPDPNRIGSCSVYSEVNPAKDLETLKLILEASQLKGLLHSGRRSNNNCSPPIVVLKPDPKPARRPEPVKATRNPKPRNIEPRRRIQTPPKPSPKKATPTVRSPRKHRSTIDDSPKEESIRSPALLQRCDELLRNIAAFTSTEHVTAVDEQPSPVSVLDSSFLGEETATSPIAKRSITEWAEPIPAVGFYVPESDRLEFGYVYDILRCSERHDTLADVYGLIEKRYGVTDASDSCVLHRKVIFDAVADIVDRKKHVSPWEAFSGRCSLLCADQLIREVWLEVRRIRESVAAEDLNDVTWWAIRKDMVGGDQGWADTSAEMCDAVVLQIERLLFKDLVAETIKDLADVAGGKILIAPRRKLVF